MVLRHHVLINLNVLFGVDLKLNLILSMNIDLPPKLFKPLNVFFLVITCSGLSPIVIVGLLLIPSLHKVSVCLISVHLQLTHVRLPVRKYLLNVICCGVVFNSNTTVLLLLRLIDLQILLSALFLFIKARRLSSTVSGRLGKELYSCFR
jgi:hypothetical protein